MLNKSTKIKIGYSYTENRNKKLVSLQLELFFKRDFLVL